MLTIPHPLPHLPPHRVDRLQGMLHDGAEFEHVARNPTRLHAFAESRTKVSSGEA